MKGRTTRDREKYLIQYASDRRGKESKRNGKIGSRGSALESHVREIAIGIAFINHSVEQSLQMS